MALAWYQLLIERLKKAYHKESSKRKGKNEPVGEGNDICHLWEQKAHLPKQDKVWVGAWKPNI